MPSQGPPGSMSQAMRTAMAAVGLGGRDSDSLSNEEHVRPGFLVSLLPYLCSPFSLSRPPLPLRCDGWAHCQRRHKISFESSSKGG